MIRYKVMDGEVRLSVEGPDDPGIIEFGDGENPASLEILKKNFEEGWPGIHGNLQFLETTAIDLAYAAAYHPFFKDLNPVLVEGQEILDAFKSDPEVMY